MTARSTDLHLADLSDNCWVGYSDNLWVSKRELHSADLMAMHLADRLVRYLAESWATTRAYLSVASLADQKAMMRAILKDASSVAPWVAQMAQTRAES